MPRSSRSPAALRHGLVRLLSKRGLCSRSEATLWILAGRVSVAGQVIRDPEHPMAPDDASIAIDGQVVGNAAPLYLMLNKPRGLVTSARDEHGRDTVYRCFDGSGLPWIAPVGRLDKASEGLLLFCNDPEWAARVTDPAQGPDKIYHVQGDTLPDETRLAALVRGVVDEGGNRLWAKSATLLRAGGKNAWLQIVLDEGRNRQIRRLLAAFDIGVLRLIRVAIGGLALGDLPKGQWRLLTPDEHGSLAHGRHSAGDQQITP